MARIRTGNTARRCSCQSRTEETPCRCHPYFGGARKHRRLSTRTEHAAKYREPPNLFNTFEAQLVLNAGPQSPDSSVSYDNVSIDGSLTSTTSELERRRLYTPIPVTPTNSDAASPEFLNFHFPQSSDQYVSYHDQDQYSTWHTFGGGQYCLSPIQHTSNLVGIAQSPSYEEAATFLHPRVEFVSPHGPTPTSHQRYPQIPEPWSGHPLRHEDPMILDQNLNPVPPAASPTSSTGDKGARRVGPLTQDQRKKANDVRIKGACLRCAYMKETCDVIDLDECRNCHQKRGRKWKLGCIRKKLYEQSAVLFPPELKFRYARTSVNEYTEKRAFFYKNHRQPFVLRLDMRLPGRPLEVLVREVELVDPKYQEAYGFQSSESSGTVRVPVWTPPVMLYLEQQAEHVHKIRAQLQFWMRNVFQTQEKVSFPVSMWPWPCFPNKANDFEGEIAHVVLKYMRRDLPSHAILEKAHSLLFFGYILDHGFMVSDAALDELLAHLQSPPPREYLADKTVSPDTITKFIRMLVFPLAMEVAESVLKALHDLLDNMALGKENTAAKTDMAFCLSFILLVFLAFTQSRVLFLSDYSAQDAGFALSPQQALEIIRAMEDELATYIILFHEFAVKRRKAPVVSSTSVDESERHAAEFDLMGQVEKLATDYSGYYHPAQSISTELPLEDTRPPNFRLRTPDIAKFDVENVHRLCWKFVDALGLNQPQ